MRVCFNTFDTHVDEDNIIDIESIAFKKTRNKRLNIQLNIVNPKGLVGELGEIGQLSFTAFDFTFTKNVIISSIYIIFLKELGESIVKYYYIFDIFP